MTSFSHVAALPNEPSVTVWTPQAPPVRAARIGGPGLRCERTGGQLWVTVPIVWGVFTPDLDETQRGWWTPDDRAAHAEMPVATLNRGGVQDVFIAGEIHVSRLRRMARECAQAHLDDTGRGFFSAALGRLGFTPGIGRNGVQAPELRPPCLEWARSPGYVAAFELRPGAQPGATSDLQQLSRDPAGSH